MAVTFSLSQDEQDLLSRLVVQVIGQRLAQEPVQAPNPLDYPENLRQHLGCFVTLTIHGYLRGCIGSIIGREPLVSNAWRMAQAAAFQDPRFAPLTRAEWPQTAVEITGLDALSPCPDPAKIVLGTHGLVLTLHGRSGVFLPQVPVEQGWDVPAYLSHLCAKAGLPDGSWKHPDAQLLWYEGFKFQATRP